MKPWDVLRETLLHDAWPWVRLSREHVRLPNGVEIPDFYRVEIRPYTMIFAINAAEEVAMIEHYRHGPGIVSLELPAGLIDGQESPLDSAQRELREETGLASDDWQDLGNYFIDGNRGCGWAHTFLARNVQQVASPQHETTEIIQLHFKPLSEVFALWRGNKLRNVTAACVIGRALLELGYLDR